VPIVCLEGPSAVGKTATAGALGRQGAHVVPEVNALFDRPADEPQGWYFERQADRWRMAVDAAGDGRLAVLDGDPFQPLWYNWSYGYEGWQPLDWMAAFYRPRITRGEVAFPDAYAIFRAPEALLRERRAGDATRRRGGFEHHLRFIAPQRRYFRAMQSLAPGLVHFIDAGSVDETAAAIHRIAEDVKGARPPLELFDAMVDWLRTHRPDEPDDEG
jgi:hypothetical protein